MIDENILNYIANWLQVFDYQMNVQQLSNDDLMQELIKQDKILDYQNKILQEQTNIYLKKIIEQNQEIIHLLKGESNEIS